MLEEAQSQKYTLDAFWLRFFKRFPEGCDPDNLYPIQREFVMYLIGFSHTEESLSVWCRYETERQKLQAVDYRTRVSYNEDVLRVMAKTKGVGFEEYLKDHIETSAEAMKKADIEKLEEKYGLKQKEDSADEAAVLLEKYAGVAEKLEGQKSELKSGYDKLWQKPEGVK